MSRRKKESYNKARKNVLSHGKTKGSISNQIPTHDTTIESIKLSSRKVRHYDTKTVHTIGQSLDKMTQHPTHTADTISAINDELEKLASTLTDILTSDPGEQEKQKHHNLLSYLMSQHNNEAIGIRLVATTNMEALVDDLQLNNQSDQYHWLLNHGSQLLENAITSRITHKIEEINRLES